CGLARVPVRAVPEHLDPQHRAGGWCSVTTSTLAGPAELVEIALAASTTAQGCVVVVRSNSTANVRWANNTVTTNGVSEDLSWFVVAFIGSSAGTVTASAETATSRESIAAVVRAAEDAARVAVDAGPARDAAPLATGN